MESKLLMNKVAIITGASSGIGESTALLFAKNGAKVVLADIDEEGGKKVKQKITDNGGEAIFVKADTSTSADSQHTVEKAKEKFGRVDIAVNNAGVGGESAPVGEHDIHSWDKTIAVNLSGVFYGMHYQIPAMLEHGGGAIVNIASILGQAGFATSCGYVAAKHGVVGLSKTAALEYSKRGIRVNSVGPGFIKTPLLEDNLDQDAMEQIAGLHPIGRLGEAEEVAELILWLSCDKASFVSGSYHAVDGGYLAQ